MYMLWNKKTSYEVNYEFENLFVRVSQGSIDDKYKYKYNLNRHEIEI